VHRLLEWQHVEPNGYTWLTPIVLSIILSALVGNLIRYISMSLKLTQSKIHYVLGHVMVSLLILESAKTREPVSSETGMKRMPSTRHIRSTLSSLYRTEGICSFFNGLGAAITYWLARSSTTRLLQWLLFRHVYLQPIAHVFSCLLLAETHLYWTACTISASAAQKKQFSWCHDRTRWKLLAIPTLIYAAAEVVINHIPSGVELLTLPAEGNAPVDSRKVILSDILVSLLLLVLQFLLLLPSYIVWISIEGSLLPEKYETIVPSHRQRGARIAELFPRGILPISWRKAYQMIRVGRWLWLIELHAKMCLCLLCVDIVTHFVVYCLR
jgi:hypothetical protein